MYIIAVFWFLIIGGFFYCLLSFNRFIGENLYSFYSHRYFETKKSIFCQCRFYGSEGVLSEKCGQKVTADLKNAVKKYGHVHK